jgi:hypothetical protein
MTVAIRPSEKTALPASSVSPEPRKPAQARTPGMLVGRPGLSDGAVLAAIAERLAFEGRDPAHAPGVLKAALAGKPLALALLRKLVLPPPQAALSMPIQEILRASRPRRASTWLRRMSFGR